MHTITALSICVCVSTFVYLPTKVKVTSVYIKGSTDRSITADEPILVAFTNKKYNDSAAVAVNIYTCC